MEWKKTEENRRKWNEIESIGREKRREKYTEKLT